MPGSGDGPGPGEPAICRGFVRDTDSFLGSVFAMHVATVNLRLKEDKHSEAVSAVDGFIRRMHAWPGCLTCRLLTDAGDGHSLTLVSEWDSREALDSFLASREFLILQGMRVVLRDDPQIVLDEILMRSRMSLGSKTY
jgi:quinol monooxygenase YgiN